MHTRVDADGQGRQRPSILIRPAELADNGVRRLWESFRRVIQMFTPDRQRRSNH